MRRWLRDAGQTVRDGWYRVLRTVQTWWAGEEPSHVSDRLAVYVHPVEEAQLSSTGSWTSLEVSCQPIAAMRDDPWPAQVHDISTDRIGLLLKRRFEPNTLLAVELQSPSQDYQRTLVARVVQARANGGGEWIIGCILANKLDHEEVESLRL